MTLSRIIKQAIAIAGFTFIYTPAHNLQADDVNNLIETILESSPAERAKVDNYSNSTKNKKSKNYVKVSRGQG